MTAEEARVTTEVYAFTSKDQLQVSSADRGFQESASATEPISHRKVLR